MQNDKAITEEAAAYLQKLKASDTPYENAALAIVEDLFSSAGGSEQVVRTVERFVVGCEDLLSGRAHEVAVELAKARSDVDPNAYAFPGTKLCSDRIERYIRLRQWPGPTSSTIRKRRPMMDYIVERRKSFAKYKKPRRGTRSALAADIVAGIEDPTDQSIVRESLAAGEKAKRELDIASRALSRLGGIKAEDLEGLDLNSVEALARSGSLSEPERKILAVLVARITNVEYLANFDLQFTFNRIMSSIDGSDLITPEELALLVRLSMPNIGNPEI